MSNISLQIGLSIVAQSVRQALGGAVTALFSRLFSTTCSLGADATFSRNDTDATVTDHEGLVHDVLAQEARFEGARRVENWIDPSDDLTDAGWAKEGSIIPVVTKDVTIGSIVADQVDFGTTSFSRLTHVFTGRGSSVARTVVFSLYAVTASGTETIRLNIRTVSGSDQFTTITVTTTPQRFSVSETIAGDATDPYIQIRNTDSNAKTVYIWNEQFEETTGRASPTIPSEYVSVGVIERNTLFYSEQFNRGEWIKSNSTIAPDAIADPNGVVSADKLIEGAVTNSFAAYQIRNTLPSNSDVVISVYAKAGERSIVQISETAGMGGTTFQNFNLTTGAIGNGNYSAGDRGIEDAGNGWYRCWVVDSAVNTSAGALFFMLDADTNARGPTYTGNGSSGLYLWGGQLETGPTLSAYQKTTSRSPSDFDGYHGANVDGVQYFPTENGNTVASNIVTEATGATISPAPHALIELNAATNLLTYSEAFDNAAWTKTDSIITADAATSPTGSAVADKLEDGTGTVTPRVFSTTAAYSIGTTYAMTVYAKAGEYDWFQLSHSNSLATDSWANFNLSTGTVGNSGPNTISTSIESIGNGWYRCGLTVTAVASASTAALLVALIGDVDVNQKYGAGTSYTGVSGNGIYIWGAQFEAGSVPTSYIPTAGAAATRNAETLSYSGIAADNETRAVENGTDVDVDDWDGVVDTTLDSDADGILELESIIVYTTGERPA